MKKVAVVYWSGTGNTEEMAKMVLRGIEVAEAEGKIYDSPELLPEIFEKYERIALGCPSMGEEGLEESEFEPSFSSVESMLVGKKIALFGSYGWGNGLWMEKWKNRCEKLGAICVSDPVICCDLPDSNVKEMCIELGRSIAEK